MPSDTLTTTTQATHARLADRLRIAETTVGSQDRPRDLFQRADTLMSTASRHLAAVDAVLLPQAERILPNGSERVHEFVHRARGLEVALAATKAKLYGEAHAVYRSWSQVWRQLEEELTDYLRLERGLVADLADRLDQETADALAYRIYRTELSSPTRPHPYTPHTGLRGRVARSLWAKADGFWDAAEGRIIPEPIHPHHRPPGLLAQYLLADPQFDLEEDVPKS